MIHALNPGKGPPGSTERMIATISWNSNQINRTKRYLHCSTDRHEDFPVVKPSIQQSETFSVRGSIGAHLVWFAANPMSQSNVGVFAVVYPYRLAPAQAARRTDENCQTPYAWSGPSEADYDNMRTLVIAFGRRSPWQKVLQGPARVDAS